MSEVWKGETVVDKGHKITWNRTSGFSTVRTWEGKYEELFAMVSSLQSAYDNIELVRIGDTPVWSLTASVGNTDSGDNSQDDPVDTHELIGNDLQQSVLINPTLTASLTGNSAGLVMRAIKLAHTNYTGGKKSYEEVAVDITTACNTAFNGSPGTATGEALNVFDDLVAGKESFVASQYVYRRTRTVSKRNTTLKAAFSNVNKIFTSAQAVITAESIPSSVNFDLPSGEWLKKTPTVNAQFGAKTQITYEYWHADEWSRLYYETAP